MELNPIFKPNLKVLEFEKKIQIIMERFVTRKN